MSNTSKDEESILITLGLNVGEKELLLIPDLLRRSLSCKYSFRVLLL